MRFLSKICERPDNERPYMLLVVGHPSDNATVPEHACGRLAPWNTSQPRAGLIALLILLHDRLHFFFLFFSQHDQLLLHL